jgi:hypothetical protein
MLLSEFIEQGKAREAQELKAKVVTGDERASVAQVIRERHYTRSVPSGKSHYVVTYRNPFVYEAIVIWSIPANKNIASFVMGGPGKVWELARLWAPDGHEKNLLTQVIKLATRIIVELENPDALVSYADPNVGHKGGVYRAASWIYHGKSEEGRAYRGPAGEVLSRRKFHSGSKSLKKAEILALGFTELKLPGKERFVKPLTKKAYRAVDKTAVKADTHKTGNLDLIGE